MHEQTVAFHLIALLRFGAFLCPKQLKPPGHARSGKLLCCQSTDAGHIVLLSSEQASADIAWLCHALQEQQLAAHDEHQETGQ